MPVRIMAQFKTMDYSSLPSSTKCTAPNITWPELLSFYNRLASDPSPQCCSSSQSCLLLTLFFYLLLIFSLWYDVVIIQSLCVCVCVCFLSIEIPSKNSGGFLPIYFPSVTYTANHTCCFFLQEIIFTLAKYLYL